MIKSSHPRSRGAPAFKPLPENVLALRQARHRRRRLYFTNKTVHPVQCHRTTRLLHLNSSNTKCKVALKFTLFVHNLKTNTFFKNVFQKSTRKIWIATARYKCCTFSSSRFARPSSTAAAAWVLCVRFPPVGKFARPPTDRKFQLGHFFYFSGNVSVIASGK